MPAPFFARPIFFPLHFLDEWAGIQCGFAARALAKGGGRRMTRLERIAIGLKRFLPIRHSPA
jgi:hypothetical protein